MCREGGRRCDARWDTAHRERYNARRRVARNSVKAQAARDAGNEAQAAMYTALVASAREIDERLSKQISQHETDPYDQEQTTATRCDRCGQYAEASHTCPGPEEQALSRWRESLTPAEREALDDYGSILHADLNEKLRAAAGGPLDSLDDDERRMLAGLDTALARAPRAEGTYTVHRGIRTETTTGEGIDGREWVAQNTPAGETVTFHGYTSTSLDPEQAEYFSNARGDYAASGVIFEIETTQGGNWAQGSPEAEVMLARGSRFEVASIDEDHTVNGRPYPKVHLREVPSLPGWADDEFVTKNGDRLYTVTEDNAVTMRTADGRQVGYITWGGHDDRIGNISVQADYQRRGVATEMLRRARQITPGLRHAKEDRRSDAARAWMNSIGEQDGHPARPATATHPLAVAPAEAFEFTYARNTESSKTHVTGNDFGQDIEPSGRYLSEAASGYAPPSGWETGTVRFERPLRIAWGEGGYADDDNWKRRLSAHYGGKTGKALSQAIRDDGYDAIVTQDKYGTSEIIDLTGFSRADDTNPANPSD